MAEQTFRSPGFFEQEIDLTSRQQSPVGVPAGIAGTSQKGPAFVPVTVGSFPDFQSKFGTLDPKKFGPYAVREFLKHRTAVTYMRVLGAGSNESTTEIETTRAQGTVTNAGFKIEGTATTPDTASGRHQGAVQFLVARHFVSASEAVGFPTAFTDNDSYGTSVDNFVNLVRAMILVPSGTRIMVLNGTGEAYVDTADDLATVTAAGRFKLVISSSTAAYSTADGNVGLRILTASLDPSLDDYIGKILNTDPEKFINEEHYLFADFTVEDELATVATEASSVAVVSGSGLTSDTSGDTAQLFRNAYGRFDARYTTPRTTAIISQPFGGTEYDLFHFEALDDGAYANTKIKVSVRDLRGSTNPADEYGTFTVNVRTYSDQDTNPEVLESFPQVSLNPRAENYIAKAVGDKKVYFNFDATDDDERRLIVQGLYPNKSRRLRIVMNPAVEKGLVPAKALPFGFRGVPVLKTSDTLTDTATVLANEGNAPARRLALSGTAATPESVLTGSVVPPLPMRFKITKGQVATAGGFSGNPGVGEIVDGRFHWGVKFERLPLTGTTSNSIYNPNIGSAQNKLVEAYGKFMGIEKMDVLVTGSGADAFGNNKFTLARVAFSNDAVTALTGGVKDHVLEMAYIRNATVDPVDYTVTDGTLPTRITYATLVNQTSSVDFNRFAEFAKFSTFMYGGYDGVNILDRDAARMNDRAASSDTGGAAASSFVSPGLTTNVNGTGKTNQTVFAYRTAARLMTDPFVVNTNILAIPGIRDSFVTDYAATKTREYSKALYLMDLAEYDEDSVRLFDNSVAKPDVRKTSEAFDSRAVDNSYTATYFPDVQIDDPVNTRRVTVPASVAAIAALAFNDKSSYPWFAPAGFNRGSLDFVANVDVRLTAGDRDVLYDARINPIATFPREGFVIFGQKTLQQARSALDRVNVRRLLLEIKRLVGDIAQRFVFEQNTAATRQKFVSQITPLLALVQTQAGVESFKVVIDATNNTNEDIEANRLNGRIVVVPTRTVEFVAVDFIITNSGVSFE
jgi:hypothetical protein